MLKHVLLVYCVVTVLTAPSCGQEVSDLLDAVVNLEERVIGILTKLNQTVTTCCQASKRCGSGTLQDNGWTLVFRGTAGAGKSSYAAYKDGSGIPENLESGCKQVGQDLPCTNHYRNSAILDNWANISDVAFAVYKNNVKVKQVIFDGAGSTYMNWLDKSRVKDASWIDVMTSSANYFSIEGHQDSNLKRTFFMNQAYGTCPNDVGWFVAVDAFNSGCTWEKGASYPMMKYSPSDARMNWNDAAIGHADYFGVLVKLNKLH